MSAADRDQTVKVGAGDTATAETTLPLLPGAVFAFLCNIEPLLRLNPQLTILRWLPAEWGFRFAGHNESNGRDFDLGVLVDIAPELLVITLRYDAGLKQETQLHVAAAAEGCRLVVTEQYPRIEDPADPRVADVDKSLVPWVTALRRHLLARQRWHWLPGWRLWHEGIMLSMPPRQRRIVRLLLWTSIIEFAVFLGLVIVLRYAA